MLGVLSGWRKASKCKKLIKRVQCRLKLLKIKRSTIANQLREDVAHLLRVGHDEIAFNRIEQLYIDENMKEVYEMLDNFCEFVLINLPYIKRHRDCPNDVKEAISSLIFASARFGDLPELQIIRKLFGERYGHKFVTSAVELHPGNLVNPQMRDKMSVNSVTEYAKNRLLDEIIRECFFKPGLLAIEYNPSEAAECNETNLESSDSSPEYPEQPIVYLDDIEEFKSSAMKDDEQDQRIFIFKPLQKLLDSPCSDSRTKSGRKRQRRRSLSKEYKISINDNEFEVYYSGNPHKKKHQKKIQDGTEVDGLVQSVESFRFWIKEEEPDSGNFSLPRPPYLRLMTMPNSLPLESEVEIKMPSLSSPRHVHPKLPDYEELEAKFMALKKFHQQANR